MVKHNKLSFENGRVYYKSKELNEIMKKRFKKINRDYKIIILSRVDIVELMIMHNIKKSKMIKLIKYLINNFSKNVKTNWTTKHNEIYWHEAYEWRKKLHLKRKRFIVYEDTKEKRQQGGDGEENKTQCDLLTEFELIDPSLAEKIKEKGRVIMWAKSRSDNKYYAVKIFDIANVDDKKRMLINHEINMLKYISKIKDISLNTNISKLHNVYNYGDKYTAIVTEALPCMCEISNEKHQCDCSNINLTDITIKKDVSSIKNIISMFHGIFKSVLFLHENSVVHTDIWRPNLVTNKLNSSMLLIDFGESCLANIDDQSNEQSSCNSTTLSGKRRIHLDVLPLHVMKLYLTSQKQITKMSPEMWMDIDIYGIALTMFLLLSKHSSIVSQRLNEVIVNFKDKKKSAAIETMEGLSKLLILLLNDQESTIIDKKLIEALIVDNKNTRVSKLNDLFNISFDGDGSKTNDNFSSPNTSEEDSNYVYGADNYTKKGDNYTTNGYLVDEHEDNKDKNNYYVYADELDENNYISENDSENNSENELDENNYVSEDDSDNSKNESN